MGVELYLIITVWIVGAYLDFVIIGSGAGGGTMAYGLTRKGYCYLYEEGGRNGVLSDRLRSDVLCIEAGADDWISGVHPDPIGSHRGLPADSIR